MEIRENRVHLRRSLETEGWVAEPNGQSWKEVKMLDLSKGGIGILGPEPMKGGSSYRFSFHLPGSPKMIHFDGRVTHCLPHPFLAGYRIGMQFQHIDSADLAMIEWFVDHYAEIPS